MTSLFRIGLKHVSLFLKLYVCFINLLLGVMAVSMFTLLVVYRLGILEFDFMSTHGRVEWASFGPKFIIISAVLSLSVAIFDFLSRWNVEKVFGILGVSVLVSFGLPMKFNAEGVRGMMWQLTDPKILETSAFSFALFFAVCAFIVFFLYRHFTFREYYSEILNVSS